MRAEDAPQGRSEMRAGGGLVLHLERVLPAPRGDVYRVLTEAEELTKWWGPEGFTAPNVDFEPRVGGRYRIAMQPREGDLFHLAGEFTEVDPPSRLAFTFRWEPPDPDDRETVAALSLREQGEETVVDFTQGEFATEERRALHDGGWRDSFDRLEELLRLEG